VSRARAGVLAVAATAAIAAALGSAVPAAAVSGGATPPAGSYGFLAKVGTADRACSGALISRAWIVTAASCFPDNPHGGVPAEAATVTIGADTRHVATLVVRDDRDLVLAKLDSAVTDTAPLAVATAAPTAGAAVRAGGYGRTATEWVPDAPHTAAFTEGASAPTTIALTGADGADTCKGDAGGPAFTETGGTAQLVAINTSSFQHGCLGVTTDQQGSTGTRTDDIAGWIAAQTGPAQLTCTAAAIWSEHPDGSLWHYLHNAPGTGAFSWVEPTSAIGAGWNGHMLAGPGGVVWDIHKNTGSGDPYPDGALKRWVRTSTGWTGGAQVGQGWQPFLAASAANQVTVDAQGRIYAVNAAGELRVYVWTAADGWGANPSGQVLDTGWGQYNSITAAGDGVLYARSANGNLYRYQYSFAGSGWTEKAELVGTGWQIFSQIFSAGGDTLYGRGATGPNPNTGQTGPVLRWYRLDDNTDTWSAGTNGAGTIIGYGWNTETDVQADPGSCTLAH
jgi:hypothetical protein